MRTPPSRSLYNTHTPAHPHTLTRTMQGHHRQLVRGEDVPRGRRRGEMQQRPAEVAPLFLRVQSGKSHHAHVVLALGTALVGGALEVTHRSFNVLLDAQASHLQVPETVQPHNAPQHVRLAEGVEWGESKVKAISGKTNQSDANVLE